MYVVCVPGHRGGASEAIIGEWLAVSAANGLPRYEALQRHYNLYDRGQYEAALEPVCVEHELGVVSYFALAKGFLTGKYRSTADLWQSPRGGGVAGYLDARGMRILTVLDEVAAAQRATPAQVALAWLMARPSVTAAIASATSLAQMEELIAAMHGRLSVEAIARLEAASAWAGYCDRRYRDGLRGVPHRAHTHRRRSMLRTAFLSMGLAAQIGLAPAQECVPLPSGAVLCEQLGSLFLVDPATGAAVDVTQEALALLSGQAAPGWDAEATHEAPVAGGGDWESRMTDLCLNGGCPGGDTSVLDAINGYIPSYQ
jgi:hypothetical protein